MSNAVKYSTSTEPLSLRIGNFHFGTGDVAKGPTSVTGFYSSIPIPSEGYVIYLYKSDAPGYLSYHIASTNSELIKFTNEIAGTSYTTVGECLTYYSQQNDRICVNGEFVEIVTDGLEINLDAVYTASYPRSGNTWYDLSGNGNNGTINGATHTDYYFDFDGTDDYISLPSQTMNRSGGTICILFNKDAENGGLLWGANYDRHLSTTTNNFYGETASNCNSFTSPTYSAGTGNWVQYTLVFSGNNAFHYVDGVSIGETPNYGSQNCGSAVSELVADFPFSRIGENTQYVGHFDGKFSVLLKYDRALTSDEITQNYQALSQRLT